MSNRKYTLDELRQRDDHDLLIITVTKQQEHEDEHENLMKNVIIPRGERLRKVEVFCWVIFIVVALFLGAWGLPIPLPAP